MNWLNTQIYDPRRSTDYASTLPQPAFGYLQDRYNYQEL